MEILSPIISIIAFCVSLFTAWFTIFRRGTIHCTHPSFIALTYEFDERSTVQAKFFLRTLLFSTGKRGLVIENLFLRVREGEREDEFSYWAYGDKEIVRGGGLFVGENGFLASHRFMPTDARELYVFKEGHYQVELVAKIFGRKKLLTISTFALDLPKKAFGYPISSKDQVYFEWSTEQNKYIRTIRQFGIGIFF